MWTKVSKKWCHRQPRTQPSSGLECSRAILAENGIECYLETVSKEELATVLSKCMEVFARINQMVEPTNRPVM